MPLSMSVMNAVEEEAVSDGLHTVLRGNISLHKSRIYLLNIFSSIS